MINLWPSIRRGRERHRHWNALPALVSLGIRLTHGGTIAFAVEVAYLVLAVTLLRTVMTSGASFGWLASIPIG